MKLVVSQSGRVHRPNCVHQGLAESWPYALTAGRSAVATAVVDCGFAVCQHCRPFSIERDKQEQLR